jgi:hypothetical protein
MSNEKEVPKLPLVDGFDNTEDGVEGDNSAGLSTQRMIHGERLTFSNDFLWLLGEDVEFPKDRELVVIDTLRLAQKWIDKRPAGHSVVAPGDKWPNLDELNAECPKSEWAKDFNGVLRGPWQRQRITYFLDLLTMTKFTWAVNTVGADICITNFCDQVALMRRFRGERVFAVVTLGDTFMSTKYGGRQRPEFIVQRWIKLGPSEPALPAPTAPSLAPAAQAVDPQNGVQTVTKPSLGEQMQDEVPFNDSPDMNAPPPPKTAAPPVQEPAVQKPQISKKGVQRIGSGRR